MAKPIMFNVERMIAVVAAEHRFILKPDDAAFALVTMNRLVLEESLEAIRAVVNQDLAQFKETAQWAHNRAESAVETEVRRLARAVNEELRIDLRNARLKSAEIVQEVKETYEKQMSNRKFTIMVLAGLLLILCGVWVGRTTASW
jgi:CHASE3 domain sensor protein